MMPQKEDYIWIDRRQVEEYRDHIFKLQAALLEIKGIDLSRHPFEGFAELMQRIASKALGMGEP